MNYFARSCLIAVLVSALASCAVSSQTDDIFREISIQPYGAIALGAAFSQADSLGERLAQNVYLLPPGFGGTRGIVVVLDSAKNVQALIFEYGAVETFDGMVGDYTSMLGEPAGTLIMKAADQAAASYVCTFWQDIRTRFEVVLRTPDLPSQLYSVMHDRSHPLEPDSCAIATYLRDLPR